MWPFSVFITFIGSSFNRSIFTSAESIKSPFDSQIDLQGLNLKRDLDHSLQSFLLSPPRDRVETYVYTNRSGKNTTLTHVSAIRHADTVPRFLDH